MFLGKIPSNDAPYQIDNVYQNDLLCKAANFGFYLKIKKNQWFIRGHLFYFWHFNCNLQRQDRVPGRVVGASSSRGGDERRIFQFAHLRWVEPIGPGSQGVNPIRVLASVLSLREMLIGFFFDWTRPHLFVYFLPTKKFPFSFIGSFTKYERYDFETFGR